MFLLMFEDHPEFSTPPDETVLTRYMSLAKFVSLLEKSCLFFCRATRLEDPYEGLFPRRTVERASEDPEVMRWLEMAEGYRNDYTVSCWYASPKDSPAMWGTYANREDAVAIGTTVGGLKNAVRTDRPVLIGAVSYLDYETAELQLRGNALQAITRKQDVFAHEQEVRALVWLKAIHADYEGPERPNYPEQVSDVGIYVPVTLPALISDVVLSALAPEWFVETIDRLLDRYGLDLEARRSALGSPPPWAIRTAKSAELPGPHLNVVPDF